MRSVTGAVAIFLIISLSLVFVGLTFSDEASARADFATWADRNTRPTAPIGYDINGSSVKTIVDWPGVRGVGNAGIGNGNVSLMDPDVINRAVSNATAGQNVSGNATAATAGDEADDREIADGDEREEEIDPAGRGFPAEGAEEAVEGAGEPEEVEEAWESLLPRHVAAASFITRGEPYAITINEPFPHILNEEPREPGVLYAKMWGLPLPGGRMMDMGIKSLGSEF